MIAAKIYLQVHEVAREVIEESEVGPEQKSFEKCKEQLFKLSSSSYSEYHIFFSVKSNRKSNQFFTAFFCFFHFDINNFTRLQQNLTGSQVSSRAPFPTHKWHLCASVVELT